MYSSARCLGRRRVAGIRTWLQSGRFYWLVRTVCLADKVCKYSRIQNCNWSKGRFIRVRRDAFQRVILNEHRKVA